MNYGQIKEELADMGFSDAAEIEEFGSIIPTSLNRAITEINTTVCPIIGTYEFEQTGNDDILYYDMAALTRVAGEECFLGFADTPVMIGDGVYKKFNNFQIENDSVLVMDGSIDGKFKVFYKKAHTPFTEESEDDEEIELPLRVHHLVPLLTAYYVWLEDEKTKAVDYYNQYEKLAQAIIEKKERPRMRIMPGGI
jgi:hypothetical protein